MKKPMSIGTESFATTGLAQQRCRDLLQRYCGNDIPAGADWDFVMALLQRHPGVANKVGAGVSGFRVVRSGGGVGIAPTLHFEVQRTDGTTEDFSFEKCLKGESPRGNALSAMRFAVADELAAARAQAGAGGGVIHAHHEGTPFLQLAGDWIAREGLRFEDVRVACPADGIGKMMADAAQMESWQEYHRTHATLVPMDAAEHLHLPRGPRRAVSALVAEPA